jgi:hypothetical protein
MAIKWNKETLREAYANYPDKNLGKKLQRIFHWALDNDFFMSTNAKYPCFGLRGRKNKRVISFQSDGKICAWLSEDRYVEIAERDSLFNELVKVNLLNENMDKSKIIGTRDLRKFLQEMNDAEIDKVLSIYNDYCD